jgi:hypothetical protein
MVALLNKLMIILNLVSGAQGYRFRVTNLATNQVQTAVRALKLFQITQLPNYMQRSMRLL